MYNQQPQKIAPPQKPVDDDREVDIDQWDDIVADKYKVPKTLMKAIRTQESNGNVNAVSPTGVKGRYQVTERTAKQYGLDRNDPFQQSVAAAKHLRNLYDSTPGNDDDERWLGSAAKFYGGDGAVKNGEISNSSLDGLSNPARYAESIAKKWGELRKAERGEMPATAQPAAPTTATSQTPKPVPRAPQQPSTQVRNVFNKTLEQDQRAAAQQARTALDFRPAGGNVARLEEQSKGVTRRVIASPQDAQRIAAREQYQQLSPTQRLATRVAARLGGASTQQISEVARPMEGSIEQAAQSLPNMAIRGAGELARAVPSLVRNPYMPTLPNQGLKPVMRQISRGADRAADVLVPENPDDQSWITGKIPRAIGSTLPMMAATVGSGGAAGVPVITGMMGGLGQYDRAVEQSGRTLTPGQQASGELLAMGTGALEGLGVGRALQKLGVTQAVKQRAAQILEEAGTEGLQQFFDNVNAAYVSSYDPSRRISNDPNKDFSDRIAPLLQGVGESALLGGIIGTGVAAPSIPGDVRAQREARVGAQQVAREPQRPMNLTPTAVGPTERVKVTPGDFQRANLETQKGFTEPLTEPLTSTPKVAPTAPITPAAEAAPAAAGMPNRADFAPGFLGDVEYQAALADAQRAPKAAKAGARAAVAKPAYDPMAFRGAIDDAKIQAGEAEAAGNWEAARDQYRSAMDTITEMQKEARRNRDAAALSELAREKSATNTNWQVAKRNAERAARQQASAPQVPPAQQVKAPALPTGDQSAIRNPQSAIENAPTRGLSAPLPASAEPAPQSRPEVAAPATPKPARGLQRNFRAGQNDGSMVFESETQRDLYDLGAALRGGGLQGGRNRNYDQEARINPLYESLQQRLGLSRDEVQQLAMDTHQDVREQMKGVKHLEERRLIDNLKPKPQPVEEITQPAAEASRTSTPSPKNQAEMPPDVGESPKISNPDSKFSPSPESQNFKNQNEILTPQTNRITEGAGDELPRQVSRPLEGQPAEVPTRFTEYEGGEVQRYSKPLEGQPVEVPEKAKPAPQYSPEEAALREREALPPVERRRALRDAVPRGQFGKLSEAAYFGAPRNESLAGNAQLRRLLDLPEMPPYRLPDAPINPKTGEPYTNPAWAEAAQDTLNALAALAGKERSSQINFGAGELSGGQQPSLAGKINPQTGKPYVYDIRPAGKPTRGEYGDLVRSIRELARQKREQIDPSLDAALKDTAKSARTAQEGYQGFVVDERLGDIENSLREIYRRGKPSREENKAHQDAFREIAAEYGVSTARADAAFAGIKAQAASRAQRAGEAQPAGANQGEGEGRSGRVVGAAEQRATGTDGRSAEGGGRAAVREAKPVEAAKPSKPERIGFHVGDVLVRNDELAKLSPEKQQRITELQQKYAALGVIRPSTEVGPNQAARMSDRQRDKMGDTLLESFKIQDEVRELLKPDAQKATENNAAELQKLKSREGQLNTEIGNLKSVYAKKLASGRDNPAKRTLKIAEDNLAEVQAKIAALQPSAAKPSPAPTFDTLAQKTTEGPAANLSRQEWGQVKHDPNTGLYWVTTFDDVGATREGYSLGRSQGRGKQKRTVAKTFESKQAAETYLDKLYARELKAGRIPAAPEKMNVPSWVDKEGKTRPALGEVEILPQTAQDKEDGFRRFRPVGENKQFPRGGTIEEAWYQSAKQATGAAPAPTFDTLAQKMAEVSPNAPDGALTSIRDLRQAMRTELPTKEAFDQFLLQQAREDKIALHHHDYPSSLTDAERADMVRDEQGNYYIGAALREPAAKASAPEAVKATPVEAVKESPQNPEPGDTIRWMAAGQEAIADVIRVDEKLGKVGVDYFGYKLIPLSEITSLKKAERNIKRAEMRRQQEAAAAEQQAKWEAERVERQKDWKTSDYRSKEFDAKAQREYARADAAIKKAKAEQAKIKPMPNGDFSASGKAEYAKQQAKIDAAETVKKQAEAYARKPRATTEQAAPSPEPAKPARKPRTKANAEPAPKPVEPVAEAKPVTPPTVAETRIARYEKAAKQYEQLAEDAKSANSEKRYRDDAARYRDLIKKEQEGQLRTVTAEGDEHTAIAQSVGKQKMDARTGLTPAQEEFVVKSIDENADAVREGQDVLIKVPGDGEFTLTSPKSASRLREAISGKPMAGESAVKPKLIPSKGSFIPSLPSMEGSLPADIGEPINMGRHHREQTVSGVFPVESVNKSGGWQGNLSPSPDYFLDGHIMIAKSAVTRKEIAGLSKPGEGKKPDAKIMGDLWQEWIKGAKKEGTLEGAFVTGKDKNIYAVVTPKDGKTPVVIDARKVRTVQEATGFDSVRVKDETSPVVFYKGDTPVAVVMPYKFGKDAAIPLKEMREAMGTPEAPTKPQFVADAEARLADYKSGRQLGGGQQLLDQAIVSGYKVYRAGMDFAQWSAAVVKDAGEAVKPHLRRAWTRIKAAAETHGPPLLAVRSISAGHLPEFLAKGDDSGISIGVTTPEKIAGLDIYGDVFLIAKPELLNKQATTYMADAMTSSRNVAMGEGSLPDQGHERYRELYWNPEPMLDPDHTWMWLGGSEYQAAKVASRKAKTRLQAKGQKEDLQALTQKQEALSQAVTGMAKLLIPPRNENSLNIQSYWETKKAVLRSLLPLVYQERALKGNEQTVLKAIVRHSLNAKDRRGIQLRPGVTEKEALAATRNILEAADAYREAIRDTPEGYLETKIHRPVTAEDFALAVVPAGTPAKVIEELKARGLEVQTYKSKNELAALVQDSKAELPQSRREWVGYKPDLQEKSSFQEFLRDEGGSASLGLGAEKILDSLRAGRRKLANSKPPEVPEDWDTAKFVGKLVQQLKPTQKKDGTVKPPVLKIDPAQQAEMSAAVSDLVKASAANDYAGIYDARERVRKIIIPESQRDVKWYDHFKSPISNLNYKGTYERVAGPKGREISELFRNAQVNLATKDVKRGDIISQLRKDLKPYQKQLQLAGKPGLASWLDNHVSALADPDSSFRGIAGVLKSFHYYTKLAYNPRSYAINLVQPLQTLWPHLTTREFGKLAMKARDPKERARVLEIVRKESGGKTEGQDERQLWTLFSMASDSNRVMGHLAGEMFADRQGLTGDAKARMAADWAKKVEYDNSQWDVPPLFRGKVASVVGQFKPFMIKNLERLHADWTKQIKETEGGGKFIEPSGKLARRAKMIAGQVAVGGVRSAIPGVKHIGGVLILGGLAKALQSAGMGEDEADKFAETIYFGAPGIIGQDLSGSMMILDEPFGKTTAEKLVNFMGGPTVSTAAKLWDSGWTLAAPEGKTAETRRRQRIGAAERIGKELVPKPLYRLGEVGAAAAQRKTPTVQMDKKAVPLSPLQTIPYAAGFTPRMQTEFYDQKEAPDWQKDIQKRFGIKPRPATGPLPRRR